MLQELTNKIKKIIPEINELKFGCNLINKQTSIDWAKNVMLLVHNIDNGTFYFKENDGSVFHQRIKFEDFENKFEIIGRDITLEDVLRCLEDTVAYKVVCSVFKNYLLIGKPSCLNKDAIKWKLNQPLHEQSEETIKELNKLI